MSLSLTWTTKAPLLPGRAYEAADYVNGKLYVIDGRNLNGALNTILVYDPTLNTWQTDSATDTLARYGVASAVDASGNIYIIGGSDGSETEFNPVTDKVTAISPLVVPVENAAAATGSDGKIYVFGGLGAGATYVSSDEVYDPTATTPQWTLTGSLPQALAGISAVADGTKIYLFGGEGAGGTLSDSVYVFDTTTGKVSPVNTSMPTAVAYATAGLVGGKIVIAGGSGAIATTQIYDPVANTWTTGPAMPTEEAVAGQGLVSNGSVLFVAGGNGNTQTLQTLSGLLTAGQLKLKTGTEGTAPVSASATFTDGNSSDTASAFTASIDWGDGTALSPDITVGTVTGLNGSFTVAGNHIYQDEGTDPVVVTISEVGGSTSSISGTATVADTSDLTATISNNSPVQGTALSVNAASDDGNDVLGTATYQWMVNTTGSFVNATGTGATTATYTPTEGDEGGTLEVVVTLANDPGNTGNTETTTVVAGLVQESPTENATVSLAGLTSGNAVEGTTVTATVTEPDAPASGINYTWKVNGATVATGTDAAGQTYTPTEGDEGQPITVSLSFTDTHGNAETGTASAGTVQESLTENASFTVAGLLNGEVLPNHPVTATMTEPDAPATGITYTWQVNGTTELTGVDAAANTFTPQATDAGKSLTLSVSFTDTHGFAETGTGPVGSVASAAPYDLNGDGISDLVFQNGGEPGIWLWNGTASTAEVGLTNPGASWHIVASRDVNGDGMSDLIWQNNDGTPGIWLMNGTTPIAEAGLANPGPTWSLVASGDVNGDGNADLIWQDVSGNLGVWEMNGTTPIAQAGIGDPGAHWNVVGTADFNGDGKDDILLQNNTTGNLQIDLMNGTSIASTVSITVGDPSWHAVSTGVFNGQADIAWQNNNGAVGLWLMNGTTPAAEAGLGNPGAGWELVSVDHFTPNGQPDLLFQNTSGATMLWEMNGTNIAAAVNLPNPGAGWQSVNGHPFVTG